MYHKLSLSKLALVAFLVAFALLFLPAGSHAQNVTMGVVNCLTGPGAVMGVAARMGSMFAVEDINAAGGVNGKKFEVLFRDDESNPQKGVSAVNELIFKQGIKVIAGEQLTNVANAVNKMINNEKVIFFVLGTGVPLVNPVEYPYTFRMNVPTDKEADVVVRYIVEKSKGKKVGIIRDSTALGQTGVNSVLISLKRYNITPVAIEQYQPNDTDMTAQLLRLRNAGAEKIIAWGQGPDFVQLSNSFARLKWYPPIGSGIGLHFEVFIQMAAKDVAANWFGTTLKAFTYPKGGTVAPNIQRLLDRIKQRYPNQPVDAKNVALIYDVCSLYAKAVENVKSQDTEKIKKYLETMPPYQGIVADYSFSPTNHDAFPISRVGLGWAMRGDQMIKERVE